jgi:hypothetical protein
MPTLEEVKDYLGIDYDDEKSNRNIERYIKITKKYLDSAIDNFEDLRRDERVKQLALFIIEDLYDRKSTTIKETSNLMKLRNSLLTQLQCEGRDGKF